MGELDPNPDIPKDLLPIVSFDQLSESHPTMRPYVIEGFLRRGETANVIASPKMGKSFLAGNIAWSIAAGRPWLTHSVHQGKVLIIDNELHRETLAERLRRIAEYMEIEQECLANVRVLSLRGQDVALGDLQIAAIEPGEYELVIVDALYRALPDGTSENDNAAMMKVYNSLDALAEKWQCAVMIIHHASKGAQGDKALTDVGAGAGAISRAADTHIAIRPHENPDLAVLECVTRSSVSPEAISVQFDWPLWRAVVDVPLVRKTGKDKGSEDRADMEKILQLIPKNDKGIQQAALKVKVGFGIDKLKRLAAKLEADGKLRTATKRKKSGGRKMVFFILGKTESKTASSTDSSDQF